MGAMVSGTSLMEGVTRMNRKLIQAAAVMPLQNDTEETAVTTAYNLLGQPVDPSTKGFVIMGGKKYFNK